MENVTIWRPAIRLFHGALGLLVLGAFLTSEDDDLVALHVRLGVGILALLVFRVALGVWGRHHERFRSFVRAPGEVLRYARAYARGRPPVHAGHNPLGGWMVIAMLGALAATGITGALVIAGPEWSGALASVLPESVADVLHELHEGLAWAVPVLVGLHVAGVLVSSLLERQNLVLGMITGRKRLGPDAAPAPEGHAGLRLAGAVAAGMLVAIVLLLVLRPGEAHADVPGARALLARYEAEARAGDPSFTGFTRAAGERLYRTTSTGARPTSCATCHSSSPRGAGRTPAGKNVKPLSPEVQADRFSDPEKAEKWFTRNCKQVLGRPCTAREKGDFLTYVVSP